MKIMSEDTSGVIAPDWYPDPSHRQDYRYWNGKVWTSNVSDAGRASVDPVFTDPDTEVLRVVRRESNLEGASGGKCQWSKVPLRAVWEAFVAESDVHRIVSWAGLLGAST